MKYFSDGLGVPTVFRRMMRADKYLAFFLLLSMVPAIAKAQAGKSDGAPSARAWELLQAGISDKSADHRAAAARALGIIAKNPQAASLAEKALDDDRPEVRAAAAASLGTMGARNSIAALQKAIDDKDGTVALAAGQSLITLGDRAGYDVYYAVLTGERKAGAGMVGDNMKLLRNRNKMIWLGIEEGMAFVPFGGIGYGAYKALTNDGKSLALAAAAKVLAKDPDPNSGKALVRATSDKSWLVRAAALNAIALRDDPSLLSQIEPEMSDQKREVGYIAAAAVIRLSGARN